MSIVGEARARAFSSIANLGWGLDALGVAVTAAHDEVLARAGQAAAGGAGAAAVTSIHVRGVGADAVPTDPARNTAGLAVEAMLGAAGRDEQIALHIVKGIRPGSGLGSSSASAAAAVVAVDALLRLMLSQEQLVGFAAEGEVAAAGARHADNVAASICGGFVAVEPTRAGEPHRLTRLRGGDAIRFVVVTPDIVVTTSEARSRLPTQIDLHTYARGCARAAMIAAAIGADDPVALGAAVEHSWVDRCRAGMIPGFERVRDAAADAGATGVMISGSGPTVAAIARDDGSGPGIAAAMKAAFAAEGIESVARVVEAAPGATLVEHGS